MAKRTAKLSPATLGKRRALRFDYAPRLLDAVPWQGNGDAPWISNAALRFTSLCPVTGQPDWGDLTISYIPNALLVESKSLKEYLTSFRMHGDFHETCVQLICRDIARRIKPFYLEVAGRFDARGSIAIWPYAQYAAPKNADAAALLRARRAAYQPGLYCAPMPGQGLA